jgi:hypothetical protein
MTLMNPDIHNPLRLSEENMQYLSMIPRGLLSSSLLQDPAEWHYIHSLAEDRAERYRLMVHKHSMSIRQHFPTYHTGHIRLVHMIPLFRYKRFHRQYNCREGV